MFQVFLAQGITVNCRRQEELTGSLLLAICYEDYAHVREVQCPLCRPPAESQNYECAMLASLFPTAYRWEDESTFRRKSALRLYSAGCPASTDISLPLGMEWAPDCFAQMCFAGAEGWLPYLHHSSRYRVGNVSVQVQTSADQYIVFPALSDYA